MRESDAPPPGDPESRRSRVWALLFIAALVIFVVWFSLANREIREPGRNTSGPGVQSASDSP